MFLVSQPVTQARPNQPLCRLLSVSHTTRVTNPVTLSLLASFPCSPSPQLRVIRTARDDSCSEGLGTRLLTFPMCDTENDLCWDCMVGSGLRDYNHCSSVVALFPGLLSPNAAEGLVKLLHKMSLGGRLEAWHFW